LKTIQRTYKVKENDTIKGVAETYGLEIQELIAYHNKRAPSHDQIRKRIPDFLREIILPTEGYILKDGKEVWANPNIEEPNNLNKPFTGKLLHQPFSKDLCYGVLKTIKSTNKEQTIKYETSVRFYPKDQDGSYYVSIDITSKTYINDKEANLIADEMALSCTEVLYPLVLKIDKNVQLIEIQNHGQILNRWEKQKKTKLKYFEGEIAKNYFQRFEETLIDESLCLHYLKNDWFLYLYFNKIYRTYFPDSKQKDEIITFPIIPNTASVEFKVNTSAKIFNKNSRLRIDTKGICNDKRSKQELEQKQFFSTLFLDKPSTKGKFRTIYFLKPNNHKIESAFLECSLELNKSKYVSISISEIDSNLESENKRHPKLIKHQHENKKSFWRSIFS